jgi:hypothetical protein
VVAGDLAFLREVDAARWLVPEEAARVLTYARDVELLERLRSP